MCHRSKKQPIQCWREDSKAKYSGQSGAGKGVGVVWREAAARPLADNTIPPLTRPNRSVAVVTRTRARSPYSPHHHQQHLSSCKWPTQWKEAEWWPSTKKKTAKRDPKNYHPNCLLTPLWENPGVTHTAKIQTPLGRPTISLKLPAIWFSGRKVSCRPVLLQSASWNHSCIGNGTFVVALDIGVGTEVSRQAEEPWDCAKRPYCNSQDYLKTGHLTGGDQRPQFRASNPPRPANPPGQRMGSSVDVYFNDILQLSFLRPGLRDDCTLAFPCDRRDWQGQVCSYHLALDNIVTWRVDGRFTWPLTKTQACLSSEPGHRQPAWHRTYGLRAESLPFRDPSPSLGWSVMGNDLSSGHARRVENNSAWRLSCGPAHLPPSKCQGG
ncbi:hypothetical protein GWK47_053025 [Chionoecetes opilio]|uniref:Uncharacterized protein n=1 Tax=Chionoecetes opilio TaxID=41210 RepID=A0A8J5CR35_CHIOP|nr:hypothetical protein GWK47_053025 [Chionoecetes opilio]